MINPETRYRVGWRALVYMILRKLKYPFIFALITGIIAFIISYLTDRLHATAASGLFGYKAQVLHAVIVTASFVTYAWIFIILLAVFLGLTALPEYFGMSVSMDAKALYIGMGILSRRYTIIPLDKIQNITVVNSPNLGLFGLTKFVVITDNEKGGEVAIPFMHKSLALDLENGLLTRTHAQ